MTLFAVIMLSISFVLLLLVTGMRPERSSVSHFELKRRIKNGDTDILLKRHEHYDDIETILRLVGTLLLVVVILLAVVVWGWFIGVIVGIVVVLSYAALAHAPPVRALGKLLYAKIEGHLLRFASKFSRILGLLRDYIPAAEVSSVGSKEELAYVVEQSAHALSADERRLVTHGLSFGDRLVSEVMTPRSVVDVVAKGELLGPLTLDTLYKTGHSRLPVIDGDIDHVIGVLYVQDLLVATSKKTPTAAEAMEKKVFYIREDHTLQHALSAFLRTHHHLFVVVNEYRETVGVLSLEDVIEALLGRKIIDEFDAHENLRAVAERNPRANNLPKPHTDV